MPLGELSDERAIVVAHRFPDRVQLLEVASVPVRELHRHSQAEMVHCRADERVEARELAPVSTGQSA